MAFSSVPWERGGSENKIVASIFVSLCFCVATTWWQKLDSNWFNTQNSGIRNQNRSDDGVLVRTGSRSGHALEAFDQGRSSQKLEKVHSDVQRWVLAQWMELKKGSTRRRSWSRSCGAKVAWKRESFGSFPLNYCWQGRTRKPSTRVSTIRRGSKGTQRYNQAFAGTLHG